MWWIILGIVTGGGLGGIIGGGIVSLLGIEIVGGVIAGGAVGAIGGGLFGAAVQEGEDLQRRNQAQQNQIHGLQIQFDNLQNQLTAAIAERDRLIITVGQLNQQIVAEIERNGVYAARVRDLERELAANELRLQQNDQRVDQLQQQIDELNAGDGISAMNPSEVRSDVLYSLPTVFDYLQKVVPKEFPGFILRNNLLISHAIIDKSGHSHTSAILPPLVAINDHLIFTTRQVLARIDAGKSDLSALQLLLNRYLLQNLNTTSYAKIIFPFLDMSKKHWLTAELKLTQKDDNNFELLAYSHDPRGGGLWRLQDFQTMATEIASCLKAKWPNAKLQIQRVASPYQSCRQSKPDRISCGPLVIKEIGMRLKDDSLDRRSPYEYGATEIVQQQIEIYKTCTSRQADSLSKIATNRYQFLTRTMGKKTPERGKSSGNGELDASMTSICHGHKF